MNIMRPLSSPMLSTFGAASANEIKDLQKALNAAARLVGTDKIPAVKETGSLSGDDGAYTAWAVYRMLKSGLARAEDIPALGYVFDGINAIIGFVEGAVDELLKVVGGDFRDAFFIAYKANYIPFTSFKPQSEFKKLVDKYGDAITAAAALIGATGTTVPGAVELPSGEPTKPSFPSVVVKPSRPAIEAAVPKFTAEMFAVYDPDLGKFRIFQARI